MFGRLPGAGVSGAASKVRIGAARIAREAGDQGMMGG